MLSFYVAAKNINLQSSNEHIQESLFNLSKVIEGRI